MSHHDVGEGGFYSESSLPDSEGISHKCAFCPVLRAVLTGGAGSVCWEKEDTRAPPWLTQ